MRVGAPNSNKHSHQASQNHINLSFITGVLRMDIQKLAKKLEPLIPDKAHHWLHLRQTADSEIRGLVDKEIALTAHKLLRDYRNKLLLSLPSKSKANRPIHLGKIIYETEKWDFGISHAELLRHIGIFGMSGSGKTNLAFHIVKQLAHKKIPFLFWDWKRTARHLVPALGGPLKVYTPGRQVSPLTFNPFFVPPGLEKEVYINHIIDIMAEAYTLGDGCRSLLQKALSTCYSSENPAPTIQEVLIELEKIPETARSKGWKVSARRALESIEFSGIASDSNGVDQEVLTKSLLSQSTIIELDALAGGDKKFLIQSLCLWLYYVQLAAGQREKLKLVIFIEEAHHLLYRREGKAKETLLEMLLRQCREIGIGIVVLDQHPHLISSAALGNTYTTICLNQKDPSDMNKAAALSLIEETDKKFLSMLPTGQAVVKLQDRWRKPFLIQVPHVAVQKGAVTDELLKDLLEGRLSIHGLRKRIRQAAPNSVPGLMFEKPLKNEDFEFIQDVIDYPDDAIRNRYQRIGFSVDKGNKVKSKLAESGMLQAVEVKSGRSRKLLLRIPAQARTTLGLAGKGSRGSIVHEYWKRFYAGVFRKEGYEVELEALRIRGTVDLLASNGSRNIAVEIETGKSNAVWNVKQDLLSGFDSVLVVATDEKALAKVEKQLAMEGLIVPDKVDVVLRDGFKECLQATLLPREQRPLSLSSCVI